MKDTLNGRSVIFVACSNDSDVMVPCITSTSTERLATLMLTFLSHDRLSDHQGKNKEYFYKRQYHTEETSKSN
jgi:hypothetical protein